jgi:spore maturation protein CgeB
MKVLVTGSDKVYAIEKLYTRYLKEIGEDVELFPAQSIFYDYYGRSIGNKLMYRLGLSGILKQINAQLIKKIEGWSPDVIWAFKGMEIFPETWRWAAQRGIKLVNYNPDSPFVFTGKGSGNKNVTDSIGLFDLHFTYNYSIKEQLEREFDKPVAYLPFGFDVSEPVYKLAHNQQEVLKLCFLGNPDEARASFIRQIAEAGIPIDVYGNDWKNFLTHENIRSFDPVYGEDFWKVLYKYRVQLNLMRLHNPDSHNMRTFEVPGIGGIMLAPLTREHSLFFEDGKEAFFFRDLEEAIDKVKLLIGMSAADAGRVREAARSRCVSSGYSYRDLAIFALSELKGLSLSY